MDFWQRYAVYCRQNGQNAYENGSLTPAQARRCQKKWAKWLKGVEGFRVEVAARREAGEDVALAEWELKQLEKRPRLPA